MRFIFLLLLSLSALPASARGKQNYLRQPSSAPGLWNDGITRGKYYIAWGYNKDWYTKTDVHVHDDVNHSMNFTLYDMKAKDHPQWQDIFRVQMSIPQYGYRMGYWTPKGRYGFEICFDHAKYIVQDYQTVHMRGTINGTWYDKDTLVSYSFMHLEHTDGANFLMLNFMYRSHTWARPMISTSVITKIGAGIVIPRSDVVLNGVEWNHCFHNAGEVYGIESGLRTEFFRFFFLETTGKLAFANYRNVLAYNPTLISHKFGAAMILIHLGVQIPAGKLKAEPQEKRSCGQGGPARG